jgi:hypothetical protein
VSLYQRIHEQQGGAPAPVAGGIDGGAPGGTITMPKPAPAPVRQDPIVAELRHRIHQQLIEELGPILFDRRIGEDDLRRRVQEQLLAALAAEDEVIEVEHAVLPVNFACPNLIRIGADGLRTGITDAMILSIQELAKSNGLPDKRACEVFIRLV